MSEGRRLSRAEVLFLSRELAEALVPSHISNVYQLTPSELLLLKLRTSRGNEQLVIEPGRRLNLSNLEYPTPAQPTRLAKRWRLLLRGAQVQGVRQHDFDRIVCFDLRTRSGDCSLVVELMDGGVAAILDPDGRVVSSTEYKVMRDRTIRRGSPYAFPPSRFVATPTATDEALAESIRGSRDLERTVSAEFGMGNLAQGIIAEADLAQGAKAIELDNQQMTRVIASIRSVFVPDFQPTPCVVISNGEVMDFCLSPQAMEAGLSVEHLDSLQQAVDRFYSKIHVARDAKARRASAEARRLEALRSELNAMISLNNRQAEAIFSRLSDVDAALQQARKGEGFRSEDGLVAIQSVRWESRTAIVQVGTEDMELSLDEGAASNASTKYDLAKKLSARLDQVEAQLAPLRSVRPSEEKMRLKPKRRRQWFEKFRWGYTSTGQLLIGGKDHVTNELLLNRHARPGSQVFHSDFPGAPFVTVVSEGPLSEAETQEAAAFAGSYTTRAWDAGFTSLDVYWVRREQLSKTPPSGEFLGKGAFAVKGARNYVKSVPLAIAIGLSTKGDVVEVFVSGAEAASKLSKVYAIVRPGKDENRRVAMRLARGFALAAKTQIGSELVEEIRSRLPGKRSAIARVSYLQPSPSASPER